MRLPLAASPAGPSWACPGVARVPALSRSAALAATKSRLKRVMVLSSTRIGDDVDQRGLAALDRRDGARQCRCEIFRVDDRSLAMDPEAACDRRIVDIRSEERR